VVNGQEDTTKTYESVRDIHMSEVVFDEEFERAIATVRAEESATVAAVGQARL
jgi:hypothetical protein